MTHRMGVISDETGGVEHIPLLARRIVCFLITDSHRRRWDLAITLGMFVVENGWWYTFDGCESGCCAKNSHIALGFSWALGHMTPLNPTIHVRFYQSTITTCRGPFAHLSHLIPVLFRRPVLSATRPVTRHQAHGDTTPRHPWENNPPRITPLPTRRVCRSDPIRSDPMPRPSRHTLASLESSFIYRLIETLEDHVDLVQ